MKRKKQKVIVIMLIIILSIVGITTYIIFHPGKDNSSSNANMENKITEEKITPLLYEVTKIGSDNKIYLFGSIHVADDRAYPLPKEVLSAYSKSDYLAVEFDIIEFTSSMKQQMEALKLLLYEDGSTIEDSLSKETYDLLIPYLEENDLYTKAYEYYRPALQYSLVSNAQTINSGLDSDKGIDMYFLEEAKEDGKEILELESALYQYELLANFPDDLFDMLIKYSIMYDEELIEETKELYESWLVGDIEKLTEQTSEEVDEEIIEEFDEYSNLTEMIDDYNDKLIARRNIQMTNNTDTYFKEEKNVFLVVGLAHIIGEDGIVDLLEEKGYTVTQIKY